MSVIEEEVVVEEAPRARLGNHIGFWLANLYVLGFFAVIMGGFTVQFMGHELPCPLCMLQRMAMVLTALGALWIVVQARRGTLTQSRYSMGLGMAIVGALAGASMSTRQILLHIMPGDPGYGGTLIGMEPRIAPSGSPAIYKDLLSIHLYTWAVITFLIAILVCGVLLIFSKETLPIAPKGGVGRGISSVVIWLFILVILANLIMVFFLEGFNWTLPDDPTGYELFK